jgi:hypothetical protein
MRQERLPEAASLPCLSHLPAVTEAGDAGEVVVGEQGVVVGEQGRPLPLRERGREQRRRAVRSAVEAEADARGAGVLDELPQRGGALRVVGEHLADAPREVHALPEVLQQHPAARIHGGGGWGSKLVGHFGSEEGRELGFGREGFFIF